MTKKLLIIDDDLDMCTLLSRFLTKNGYDVATAHSATTGLSTFKEEKSDIVLCDFRLGDKDGKDVLAEIKKQSPQTIVVIITGYSDIKTAVDVIKMGAYDYITKPLIPDEVLQVLSDAIDAPRREHNPIVDLEASKTGGKSKSGNSGFSSEFLVGKDPKTKKLYEQIDIVAPTAYSIILYGESGTGKEVIAKTIHNKSERSDKPFIAMDCGTLSKELSGSELFGHVKGAFTGALTDKTGHFELANGGTLFLDEVANLSAEIQASLLRVIQERKYKKVGGNNEKPVDVRIIVASNENLQDAYRKGNFREDLYHRFNEFSINLPSLRDRPKDIPLFAQFFLEKSLAELDKSLEGFEPDVMEMFVNYSWPGNLREFRNVVRRSVLLTAEGKINSDTLPWEIINPAVSPANLSSKKTNTEGRTDAPNSSNAPSYDLKSSASKAEYDAILAVLKEVKFNKTKAAEILNIDRKTLYNKIKSYSELNKE